MTPSDETPGAVADLPVPAPAAAPAAPVISPEDHQTALVENAILRARIQYPQVPEDLLRKFRGQKPEDWFEFAGFAANSIPAAAPAPAVPPSSPAPASAPVAAGEPVPAPGPGGTVSPTAAREMRNKELRQKVIRKTASQDEASELADTTLIAAFNKHMKERKVQR
jgi:hypothetical protein